MDPATIATVIIGAASCAISLAIALKSYDITHSVRDMHNDLTMRIISASSSFRSPSPPASDAETPHSPRPGR